VLLVVITALPVALYAFHVLDAASLRERIAGFLGSALAGPAGLGGYPPIVVHGRERSHAT